MELSMEMLGSGSEPGRAARWLGRPQWAWVGFAGAGKVDLGARRVWLRGEASLGNRPGRSWTPGAGAPVHWEGLPLTTVTCRSTGVGGAPGPAAVGLFAGSMMMAEHHRVLPESLNSLQPPTIEEETAPEWSESRSRSRKGVAGWGLELGPV